VINITDGESTDGDPIPDAKALGSMGTEDGATLLFNIHLSSSPAIPSSFRTTRGLPDKFPSSLTSVSA